MEAQFTPPPARTSSVLQLYLLGAPQILHQGQSLTLLLSRRAQALFYFLVVERKLHERTYLASLFWPDVTDTQARKNLRNILPELRTYLGDYLHIDNQCMGVIHLESLWCDIYVLEQAKNSTTLTSIENDFWELSTLYQGEFLESFSVAHAPFFDEWILSRREHYRIVILETLHLWASHLLDGGKIELGIQATRTLIKIEPLNEAAYRMLMHFLVLNGQRSAALAQYETLKRLLAQELGVDPTGETQSLVATFQLEQLPSTSLSAETSGPTPPQPRIADNLPGELTSFIGRQREIQEVYTALCSPDCRLITVTGLGGIGKTRLVLSVARLFLERDGAAAEGERTLFIDGVYFVSLGGVEADDQSHSALALAIIDALKLTRNSQADPAKQLLLELSDKEVLLILDNYEHLLSANNFLLELLCNSSKSKLLITSRSILDLQIEKVYALEGLAVPPVATVATDDKRSLESYESVVLFRARMQHAMSKMVTKQEDLAEILQICRYVDGLPLAIELAAAMTRYYRCEEIWQKLSTETAALDTTLQDVPERHRSLRSIVDYSCQLLTESQCRVLEVCAIFVEAFTVQAGSFVANAEPLLLFSLADASLLKPTDAGRFELHPLVQQYALAKLRSKPEIELEARRRHAEYFANLIEPDAHELLRSPIKFHLVHRELTNLRIAWHFAAEHKLYEILRKLADGIFLHFLFEGPISEGIDICEAGGNAYAAADQAKLSHAELQFQSTLLAGKMFYLMFNGNEQEFNMELEQAFPLAEKTGNWRALTMLYLAISHRDFLQGNFVASERYHQLGLEAAHIGNVPYLAGAHLAHCSAVIATQGRIAEAIATAQNSFHILQQHGYEMLYGYLLTELSFIYLLAGELRLVDETVEQALQANQAANATLNLNYLYERMALHAEALGDYEQACNWANRSVLQSTAIHNLEHYSTSLLVRGRLHVQLGNLSAAHADFEQALATSKRLRLNIHTSKAHVELGNVLMYGRLWSDAKHHFEQAISLCDSDSSFLTIAYTGLAHCLLEEEREREAQILSEKALELLLNHPPETQYNVVDAALQLYSLLVAFGNARSAMPLLRAHEYVTIQSEKINDDTLRHAFLEKVTAHRQLLALVREKGLLA